MIAKRRYPDEPESVPEARRFIESTLRNVPVQVREVVALLVSELATNAVRHAGTHFTVCVELAEGAIRVEVTDPAAEMPVRRSPSPTDTGGRGLHIVDRLAQDWGVIAESPAGKTVWFKVALDASPRTATTR